MDEKYKIVEYDKYCSTCEHYNKGETDNIKDDICDECLEESGRVDSHKPINYKEQHTSQKKQALL